MNDTLCLILGLIFGPMLEALLICLFVIWPVKFLWWLVTRARVYFFGSEVL